MKTWVALYFQTKHTATGKRRLVFFWLQLCAALTLNRLVKFSCCNSGEYCNGRIWFETRTWMMHRTRSSAAGNLLSILTLTQWDLLCAIGQQPSLCKSRLLYLCVCVWQQKRKTKRKKRTSLSECLHANILRQAWENPVCVMKLSKFCVLKKSKKKKKVYRHKHFCWNCPLTGPTQLRTITACLHMAAMESGSSTSATMMSTSVLSSGLPANTHSVRVGYIIYFNPNVCQ